MKFALVNGVRLEAQKGLPGICIGCAQPLVPKCGTVRIHHWSHKSECQCDQWWENETEWHRAWKNQFPIECQEIRNQAENGEWHIADVRTPQGHILEFQHSYLKPEERHARNRFYGDKLVWIVDGLRLERDWSAFEKCLKDSSQVSPHYPIFTFPFLYWGGSLEAWSQCRGFVAFDFGPEELLWVLVPNGMGTGRYVFSCSRVSFIQLYSDKVNGPSIVDFTNCLREIILSYENPLEKKESAWRSFWKDKFPPSLQGIRKPHLKEYYGRGNTLGINNRRYSADVVTMEGYLINTVGINNQHYIADVATTEGYIVDFQDSLISRRGKYLRSDLYREKFIWVVNVQRQAKDVDLLSLVLNNRHPEPTIDFLKTVKWKGHSEHPWAYLPNESIPPLIKEWMEAPGLVFLDFGSHLPLFGLLPIDSGRVSKVFRVDRFYFTKLLNSFKFLDLINWVRGLIRDYEMVLSP